MAGIPTSKVSSAMLAAASRDCMRLPSWDATPAPTTLPSRSRPVNCSCTECRQLFSTQLLYTEYLAGKVVLDIEARLVILEFELNLLFPEDASGRELQMMSDTSPGKKRKVRKHNKAHARPVTSEEPIHISSSQSVEETANSAEPPNTETDEGELTSCKRVKLSQIGSRRQQIEDPGSEEQVILSPTALPNEDSNRQGIFLGTYRRAKDWLLQRSSYPTIHIPNRSTSYDADAVPITLPGDKTMSRRVDQPGQFRPTNRLKTDDKKTFTPTRPTSKRFFDFSQDTHENLVLAPRLSSSKKQKVGPAKSIRRSSSNVLNDICDLGDAHSPSSLGSGTVKTAHSFGSRPPQTTRSTLGDVHEYRAVEAVVGFSRKFRKGASGEKLSKELSPQSQSGLFQKPPRFSGVEMPAPQFGDQLPIDLEGDDDEIQELSPLPARYKGTANLGSSSVKRRGLQGSGRKEPDGPAKSKYFEDDISDMTRREEKGGLESSSRPSRKVPSGVLKRKLSRQLELEFDKEDSIDPLAEDHNMVMVPRQVPQQTLSVDNEEVTASNVSRSVSTSGDIRPSNLKLRSESSRKKNPSRNSEFSYQLSYFQAGKHAWSQGTGEEGKWELRLNKQSQHFEPIFDDQLASHKIPALVLKPQAIQKILYHATSSKLQILKAGELGLPPKIHLQMEGTSSEDLVQKLQSMNPHIKIIETKQERLNEIFKKQGEDATSYMSKPGEDATSYMSKQQEIELLESKKQRREEGFEETKKVASANSARQKSGQNVLEPAAEPRRDFEILAPRPPRQSTANKMRPQEPSITQNLDSASQDDDSFPNISQLRAGDKPATRSSARNQTQEPKSQTPEMMRWTEENPGWRNEIDWASSLVYPPDAKKKTTVDIEDIPRLDEGQFLNDNLIQFYLRYQEYKLEKSHPKMSKRIYFQNTFFYESLTKGKIRNGNINYDAVKRWTAKVDLFEYDYIIVPVNESFHWYLAIIYNPSKLIRPDVAEIPDSLEIDLIRDSQNIDDNEEPSHEVVEVVQQSLEDASGSPDSMSQKVAREVEQMSLEDEDAQWPEADPLPNLNAHLTSRGVKPDRSETAKEAPARTEQSKGLPRGRKPKSRNSLPRFDINGPKIITLDSLGNSHSATCVRLREYLVCEARERHSLDISIPSQLGMTAKNIPEQTNHCDCGIFILGYIEKFLDDPDEFVRLILQREMKVKEDWSGMDPSTIRRNIRELILHLQTEQIQRDTLQRSAKRAAKASKAAKGRAYPVTRDALPSSHASSAPSSPFHSPPGARETAQFNTSEIENRNGTTHESNDILYSSQDRTITDHGREEVVSESSLIEDDSDVAEIPTISAEATLRQRNTRSGSDILGRPLQKSLVSPPASKVGVKNAQNPFRLRAKKHVDNEVVITESSKRARDPLSSLVKDEKLVDGLQNQRQQAKEDDFEDIIAQTDAAKLNYLVRADESQVGSSRSKTPAPSTSPTMETRSSPRSLRKKFDSH